MMFLYLFLLNQTYGIETNSINNNSKNNLVSTNSTLASDIFNTGSLKVPFNVKSFVILIPDEGHHGPTEEDSRYLDQPFVPQNITINTNTSIIWYSGDINHDHIINVMNDQNNQKLLFTSEIFPSNEATKKFTFTTPGIYSYQDPTEWEDEFIMKGNIKVIDNENISNNTNFDTMGVFMIPQDNFEKYKSELTDMGFVIDSYHIFEDKRGEGKQVLLVWLSENPESAISNLKKITPELPYN